MSQDSAIAKARHLQEIMTRRGVRCTVELKAGRSWSGDPWFSPKRVIMNHHTAGSPNGLTPSYALCRNGRSDLPGPLCNGYGGRDHVYRIITLGLANHPGTGGPLTADGFTIPKDSARVSAWGTEWEHNGTSPWPADMREFMGRANAGLLEWHAVGLGRSVEHSTWTSRKIDRNTYTAARGQAEIAPFLTSEEDDMPALTDGQAYQLDWLFNEFSRLYDHPLRHADANGQVFRETPVAQILWARAEAYRAKEAAQQAVARIGALEGAVAALAGGDLTPEQVTEAAKDGAAAALAERIDSARVEITPKETA